MWGKKARRAWLRESLLWILTIIGSFRKKVLGSGLQEAIFQENSKDGNIAKPSPSTSGEAGRIHVIHTETIHKGRLAERAADSLENLPSLFHQKVEGQLFVE